MSMSVGSVTVASDETASGTGAAKAVYDATVGSLTLPVVPTLNATTAPYRAERPVSAADITIVQNARLAALRNHAFACTVVGTLVTYIASNAAIGHGTLVAHVTSEQLGRVSGTPIDPPAAPVDIPLIGAGTIG